MGDSPTSKLLRDYAPTPTDLRRFIWTGEALTFSHGHRITPALKAFIWKNLDRHPEFTREYFAVFPDEYLDRAARDPEFAACYEENDSWTERDLHFLLEDLQGDAKFLRGRLHGAELRKYLDELRVQQLKVLVSRAFLRLSPEEQELCIKSAQVPKPFPGTSPCGTQNRMLKPLLRRLANGYAIWVARCLRFLARPANSKLARQLSGEYLRLSRLHAASNVDLEELAPHLFARALLTVDWAGRPDFEKVLSDWPDEGMLGIELDPESGTDELAHMLSTQKSSRIRRVCLELLADLAEESGSEPALALLLKHADRRQFIDPLPIPSLALRDACKTCLRTSRDRNRVQLALDLLVEAGDSSAIPLVRTLDEGIGINRSAHLLRLGDLEPKREAARLYAGGPDDWPVTRREQAQPLNALFEELVQLWNRRPNDATKRMLLASPCDATDRWLVQQLLDKPGPEMLAEASRRRRDLRQRNELLKQLAHRSGSLRGLYSLLCGHLPDLYRVLEGEDEDASLALLAAATHVRAPLPLEPLTELAKRNPVLRRAVLSYLVRVDGPEVRRLLREHFGEGSRPGMLGSQSFQNDAAAVRERMRLLSSDDWALALVTRETTFILQQDLQGRYHLQRNSDAKRPCPTEIAEEILESADPDEALLFNRLDGPGSQEILLLWNRYGQFRQAYFSDPDPSTPQGRLVLHLLDKLSKAYAHQPKTK